MLKMVESQGRLLRREAQKKSQEGMAKEVGRKPGDKSLTAVKE